MVWLKSLTINNVIESLLRFLWRTFLKPLNGTCLIFALTGNVLEIVVFPKKMSSKFLNFTFSFYVFTETNAQASTKVYVSIQQ